MRARHQAECQDQHRQDRAGRKRIAKKRQCAVTAGKLHGHDARADNCGEQEGRAPDTRQRTVAPAMASRRLDRLCRRTFHAADFPQLALQA